MTVSLGGMYIERVTDCGIGTHKKVPVLIYIAVYTGNISRYTIGIHQGMHIRSYQ